MPFHAPPSPVLQPAAKRARTSSPDESANAAAAGQSPASDLAPDASSGPGSALGGGGGAGKAGQSSNFRNVSACNRCRLRKNRCDQGLPSCASCEKAGVPCVGYDPITKKEIPRRSDQRADGGRGDPVLWFPLISLLTAGAVMSTIWRRGWSSSRRSCTPAASPSRRPRTSSTAPAA